jgi:hypothetical protein
VEIEEPCRTERPDKRERRSSRDRLAENRGRACFISWLLWATLRPRGPASSLLPAPRGTLNSYGNGHERCTFSRDRPLASFRNAVGIPTGDGGM